jgi:ribose transport system substrate-binding protein
MRLSSALVITGTSISVVSQLGNFATMSISIFTSICRVLSAGLLIAPFCLSVLAQEVSLMKGVVPRSQDNPQTEVNQFKKRGPWKIGMSHFGLSNSWAVQMAREAEHEAAGHPNVTKFIFRDAGLSATKQSADINEMLIAKVDALIVTPLTPTSANYGISKAIAAGIPVIVHTGITKNQNYTVEIQGGGEYFGRVMGDWLVSELGGKGKIWVLRGVYRHPEDINRYQGLLNALQGTQVKVYWGGFGDWNYKGGKALCEELYKITPHIDGIWSSGADMARACIDVFKQKNAPIPPITGEGNNGFLKIWRDNNLKSIAPEYGPEQGAAGVRAAIALLEGKSLYKHYVYNPPPMTADDRDRVLRDDLKDEYWFPSALSEAKKKRRFMAYRNDVV